MLELPIDEPSGHDPEDDYSGPGLRSDVLPAGLARASVSVQDVVSGESLDLPDGTYLALAETEPPVYVRGRAEALSPVPAQVDIIDGVRMPPEPRTTTESATDIEVVATSLTELLARALDTNGRLEMPSQGRLNARIDARWSR